MKQSRIWLLALVSVLTLMATSTLVIAADAVTKGQVEVGVAAQSTDDNPARVNEYTNNKSDDGASATIKTDWEHFSGNSKVEFGADFKGTHDQEVEFKVDANRIFKFGLDYNKLQHWKDHETLDQMGATLAGDTGGGQPSVTTDKTFFDSGAASVGGMSPGYTPAEAGEFYQQELDNDYIITRREFKNEADLTIPQFPNVTIHTGLRIEEREGLEQAIGLSKCSSCHVSAEGKSIDERTKDFTLGATGKFGALTVEYEYLNRSFEEQAGNSNRYYANVGTVSQQERLLYFGDDLDYNVTPDSDKDAHSLKLRVDLPNNTSITGSYVKSEVESSKDDLSDPGYVLEDGDTLTTEYESFGAKLATTFAGIRFSLRGSTYKIDVDDNVLYFADRIDYMTNQLPADPTVFNSLRDDYHSAEAREVKELGLDAVYRLTKGTTVRLGYEFEEVERDEEELGETETHTFKAALKSRINKQLSGRISYQYQDIDEPFAAHDATGIYQGTGIEDALGSGLWYQDLTADASSSLFYWDVVYPERTLDATNQPDTVHEAKINTTWSPRANMAATFFARVRYEENNAVDYAQETYVPGMSMWIAPNDKMNLTMAYTFNKMKTENRMCVGWYHG